MTECNAATVHDQSTSGERGAATFWLGGTSKIDVDTGGRLEIFLRQQSHQRSERSDPGRARHRTARYPGVELRTGILDRHPWQPDRGSAPAEVDRHQGRQQHHDPGGHAVPTRLRRARRQLARRWLTDPAVAAPGPSRPPQRTHNFCTTAAQHCRSAVKSERGSGDKQPWRTHRILIPRSTTRRTSACVAATGEPRSSRS